MRPVGLAEALIREVKREIAVSEKETSRAKVSDLYTIGRLQGALDGLDKALVIIEKVISGSEEN